MAGIDKCGARDMGLRLWLHSPEEAEKKRRLIFGFLHFFFCFFWNSIFWLVFF